MPQAESASARIAVLQAQIEELEQTALAELKMKRGELVQQLADVDTELAHLTGNKPTVFKRKNTRSAIAGSTPTLQELTDLFSGLEGKALNLRKEGLDVKNVKALVAKNPLLLKMGGKGAWPEVTLMKYRDE